MTLVSVDITHAKVSGIPSDGRESFVQGPDWDASHKINPITLLEALNIVIVSGDPNGTSPPSQGAIAWDQSNSQVWIHVSGLTWTSLIRSDGGAFPTQTAFAFLGDSNNLSMGVTTDKAVRWNNIVNNGSVVPNTKVVLDDAYATASSEPLTIVDLGVGDLRAQNVSSFPGYGYELSFGQAMFDLLNGVGTPATLLNKPWLLKFGISGVELKQMLPASTYGQITPAFNGLNAYNYWKLRVQTILGLSGRKLGGIVITLGGNDGSNSTDANNVAANMIILANQIRTDFGPQVAIVWVKLHPSADVPFNSTVRSQMTLGASQIPGCKLMIIDDMPILADLLHFGADSIWDMGLRAAQFMRKLRGISARVCPTLTVVGYGTPDYNNSTLTPKGFALSENGDAELLIVASMKNSGSPTPISTPSGWTSLGNSSSAASGETQEFALFRRYLTQTDLDANNGIPPAVSISLGNDENYAVRFSIRGPNPFPTLDGSVVTFAGNAFSSSGVNAGGVTTTGTNDLVLTTVVSQGGGLSLTEHFSASNNITNPQLIFDAPLVMNTGNFGLLALFAGIKSTPGSTGTTIITPSISTNPCGFTVAFKS